MHADSDQEIALRGHSISTLELFIELGDTGQSHRSGLRGRMEVTAMDISRAHLRTLGFIPEFASAPFGELIMRSAFLEIAMVKWKNRTAL